MITVVVPTMWRYAPFPDFLKYIVKLDVVTEVIIINNDREKTPDHEVLQNPKVKIADFGRNIFVNPAWNYGVNASSNDVVCIMNDDVIFDIRVFYKIAEFIKPDMGAFGIMTGHISLGQTPVTTGEIKFEAFTNQNCWGFGELMFLHKKHWIDIPDGLNIAFGDVFIFERYCFNGFQNYFITNMFHHHAGAQSQKTTPNSDALIRLSQEQAIYDRAKKEIIFAGHGK